jgi:para-nitrobenzyl esterase
MTGSPRGAGWVDRRRLLASGAAALAARPARARALTGPIIETAAGKVAGYANGPVRIFKGIPYGAPTGGAGRFMPPQSAAPWRGVRDATRIGPRCPQSPTPGLMPEEVSWRRIRGGVGRQRAL